MRIALDARNLYRPERRGIGKSLLELYRHLALVRPNWEVLAYHRQSGKLEPLLPEGFATPRLIEIPGDRFDAWSHLRLPLAARADRADVIHAPANQGPLWMPLPTVVTVHDLIPMEGPAADTAPGRRFTRGVRQACRRAAAITCPSSYTREQLVERLAADPERVWVTPWGAGPSPNLSVHELRGLVRRYGIRQPLVLHFGASDPRKNTRRVLEAWAMLRHVVRRRWTLLVVGLDDAAKAEYARCCERLGIEGSVVLRGYVPDADAAALLQLAEILAYPSLSEGFGMPLLEAFAADTAVLTSHGTSLPEVAGQAALRVDPADWRSIQLGLSRLMSENLLRHHFIQRGKQRLARFDWYRCAETFAQAVEAAAKLPPQTGRAAA